MSTQEQPHWRRLLLRTEATADYYQDQIATRDKSICYMCEDKAAIIEAYEHWVLMKNEFPYDRYFSKSDLLVTKRHVQEPDLNEAELKELQELKNGPLSEHYDSLLTHFPKQRSIPGHHHLHIIQYKRHDGLPRE